MVIFERHGLSRQKPDKNKKIMKKHMYINKF